MHTPERDQAYVEFAETLPAYFAYSESLDLVKIGFSSNVRQRLTAIPVDRRDAGKLVLIGWQVGGPRLESELHDLFSTAHESGEWFHAVPSIAEYIEDEGDEGEPPIIQGEFRVTTKGYWSARNRLAMAEASDRVVKDFGGGLVFRASESAYMKALPTEKVGA